MFLKIVFFLFIVWFAACGGDAPEPEDSLSSTESQQSSPGSPNSEPGNPGGGQGAVAFNTHVRTLKKISTAQSLPEPELISTMQTNWHGDNYTVTARYRAAPEFNEVLALDPSSDVVWPGAVLQGESVLSGDYVPLSGKRSPVTFSISLENIQGKRFATVDNPRLSSIRQAVGEMLSQSITGSTPARVSFSIEEVHDAQQLALAVGASAGGANNMIKTQFDFSNSANRSRILVKFIQVYYTLDIDIPDHPSDLFAHDANLNAMREDMYELSPLYISSISYGRMAFFSFESTSDIESLKAAVSASCQAFLGGINGNISLAHETVLSSANISATIIGGNGATAANAIRGFDGLKLHLLAGGNYDKGSPGAPVSYKMRYLADNTTARFVLSSEYEAKHTYRAYDWYAVRDLRIACGDENGAGSSAKFFGTCEVSMKTNGANVPGYENGSPAKSSQVWVVLPQQSSNWNLDPGQWKNFGTERLFRVRRLDLDKAVLRVNGDVYSTGFFLDNSLGKKELSITLDAIPEGMIWLPQFVDGSTKARIGFSITRLPP
jgi:thiol-activated cytolysin